MIYKNDEPSLISHYKAFTMNGANMSPAINEGDFMVVDTEQRFIISGEIYIIKYKDSTVVSRLLLDREIVTLLFDNLKKTLEEPLNNISIIGRVIEVKTLS